jgi:hypothetical protein
MSSLAACAVFLALAVPTPKDAKESEAVAAPTGPAPRLLYVKADADGKVRIPAQPQGGAVAMQIQIGNGAPGAPAGGAQVVQAFAAAAAPVELKDLKEVSVTTTSGTKVDIADATKRLAAGGYVLTSADGKAISPEWLRLFRGDSVLVVTSPDLAAGNTGGVRVFPGGAGGFGGAGGIRPVPLPIVPPAPKKE